MQSLEPVLAAHPFFQDLDPSALHLLAGCATNVRFDAGTYLTRMGEAADQFYIIRHGKVAVETYTPNRGPITVQTLQHGEILGWSWLVPPHSWRFDARATQLTRAIALDGKCLREKCDTNHELGYTLLKRFAAVVAQRLEATRLQLLDVYGVHT